MRLVLPRPFRVGRADRSTFGCSDLPREPFLDVVTQPLVLGELRGLGTPSSSLGVQLGRRRLVVEPPCPRGRVAARLPRDRRRGPAPSASDLADTMALRSQQREVLALGEGEIAARDRRRQTWVHPASVAKPPVADRGWHPSLGSRHVGLDPRAIVGAPGEGICPRYSCTCFCRSRIVVIDTSIVEVLRPPVESALEAAVGVVNQAVELVAGTPAVLHGHLERVEHLVRARRCRGLAAHDEAGVDVDDERDVHPAGAGFDVGEIGDFEPVRGRRPEVPVDQIRRSL